MSGAVRDAGALSTRLTVLAPLEVPDDQGGTVRSWQEAGVIWGQVLPERGAYVNEGGLTVSQVVYQVTVRASADLSTAHRLRSSALTLVIEAIALTADKRFLQLDCIEWRP